MPAAGVDAEVDGAVVVRWGADAGGVGFAGEVAAAVRRWTWGAAGAAPGPETGAPSPARRVPDPVEGAACR
ncbi:hypothetical protein [Actinacidiphila sp. bgisy145]|uniref:hypothetical protein n=1 Tax=Actinacidiphila sp. bgisy145 TaxID=3413792 RepID=UPI003EBCD30E